MLNRKERRALALMLWLPVLGWLVSTTAVTALPHSAWRGATEPVVVEDMRQLLPQGWAFFTRDPQESRVYAYVEADGEWRSAAYPATGSVRWLFGVNRGARLSGAEIGVVSAHLPASAWAECGRGDHAACLRSLEPVPGVRVANDTADRTLCGTVGLVGQEPVPWAWNRSAEAVRMPLTGVVVEVTCAPR